MTQNKEPDTGPGPLLDQSSHSAFRGCLVSEITSSNSTSSWGKGTSKPGRGELVFPTSHRKFWPGGGQHLNASTSSPRTFALPAKNLGREHRGRATHSSFIAKNIRVLRWLLFKMIQWWVIGKVSTLYTCKTFCCFEAGVAVAFSTVLLVWQPLVKIRKGWFPKPFRKAIPHKMVPASTETWAASPSQHLIKVWENSLHQPIQQRPPLKQTAGFK